MKLLRFTRSLVFLALLAFADDQHQHALSEHEVGAVRFNRHSCSPNVQRISTAQLHCSIHSSTNSRAGHSKRSDER